MLVGIGGAIACIASIGLAFGCRAIVQLGERDLVGQITASYRAAAVQSNESTADEPDLAGLERLADRREISVFTLAILNNRWNAALANDGKIDVRELHHGMELVHDIVRTGGNVDIEQYRDAR